MNYTLTAITTVADCDALLQAADADQRELNIKKILQDRAYETSSTGATGIDAQLAATIAEITGLQAAVNNLPEGPSKQNMVDKIADLQHKKYVLDKRRRKYGSLAMVQKQYTISSIETQIAANVSFIDAVTQRKGELGDA